MTVGHVKGYACIMVRVVGAVRARRRSRQTRTPISNSPGSCKATPIICFLVGWVVSWSAGPGGNHLGQGRLRLARTLVLFLLVAVAPQVPVYGTATPSSGGSGSTHVGPLEPGSTDHGDKRTPKVVYELLNCKVYVPLL
ncbi:hypothetical protein DFJ77DRAFT_444310 [Powellomyces hirtus]|nr:hypothetical protein DFJ77DRAFT_444310 [Powellomyces hirtus]